MQTGGRLLPVGTEREFDMSAYKYDAVTGRVLHTPSRFSSESTVGEVLYYLDHFPLRYIPYKTMTWDDTVRLANRIREDRLHYGFRSKWQYTHNSRY